ncbi:MAG: DedA family protein [Firmicutes bacterium]|nr:DedA family protein [Bacillota bacterium]MBE3590599.1 DedA family protein [Bacillota bacterium]
MAIENANIPLPSEVILPFAGYLVFTGALKFWGAVAAAMAGGLCGSAFSYALGYFGGRPLVLRYGRYVLLNAHHLEQAEAWFRRHGEAAVFFGRLLPVVRTFISLPAGIGRMAFGRFLLYTLLGSLPWTTALVWAGVILGERWSALEGFFHRLDYAIVAAALVAAVVLLWRGRGSDRPRR